MGQTRDADLHRLYARHLAPDGPAAIGVDIDPELLAVVRGHRHLAARRTPDDPLVVVGTAGSPDAGAIVDVITDEMPFVVESLLAGLDRVEAKVRRVIHPTVVVRRTARGELTEVLTAALADRLPPGTTAETWIRIELEPFPADDELAAELRLVLRDVRAVALDRSRLVETARSVAAGLPDLSPASPRAEVQDAARLLRWLADGRFALLGYLRHESDATADGRAGPQPVPASGLGLLRRSDVAARVFPEALDTGGPAARQVLVLTRASAPSRVYRPEHPSLLALRLVDGAGRVVEHRFLGALTAAALHESVLDIPGIERSVRAAIRAAGAPPESYAGQRMLEVISEYPREELFWAGEQLLRDIAVGVPALTQPRRLRLFLAREPYRRYFSCLVYLPRDRYSTRTQLAMQKVLMHELHGWRVEHTARVGRSNLALVHFTVHCDLAAAPPDQARLQGQLAAAIMTWDEWVLDVAGADDAEIADYVAGVPEGYKDDVDPVRALGDLRVVRDLGADPQLQLTIDAGPDAGEMRFRLFLLGAGVTLSAVLPVLQSLGVEVLDERPHEFTRPDGSRCWIYDFGLRLDGATREAVAGRDPEETQRLFCAAFLAAWRGDAEVDGFNALVLRAGLPWQEAALLRAYARYTAQLGGPFGLQYVVDTLIAHPAVTAALVCLFRARFDPAPGPARRDRAYRTALAQASALIDEVPGLDADRILRAYLSVITATLRTNYYRERPFLSFKLDPGAVPDMPVPRPMFEIFVYSPRVEGVHLRFGPVARGGLRWSDRPQDYRTEILGLVKAQAVKNAVIVPVGAKGGFVVRRSDAGPDEVAACYRTFVCGLLDVTDDRAMVDGREAAVPPQGVVRHDGDDSYLVVAADKGTARFSDLANEVAASYGFWLGDAFASGGSVGYDHKAMGITARGAWESVRRHFRELAVDTQREPFSVVGVGDMSGDVFGNGMLLSRHIRLLAAFDHRHVFVDPDPDPARSHRERERLFGLPRSSWDDYDRAAISAGGGVWPRTAKAVPVGPEMRAALGIADAVERLSPPELIRAVLRAPADLLWNGGIGTYVKAVGESHADVGDKANDAVRVNGGELRVKVVGEGGNLGLTQHGRIEFARTGGRINTDAIDNSAGVDCSDHEVNIKILLDRLVAAGQLERAQRNTLLAAMTDEVAELVLAHNRAQNAVLGIALTQAADTAAEHARIVADLARRGLRPALDGLPEPAEFAELVDEHRGLSSPQLATLLAHVKLDLKTDILQSDLPDLPAAADRLVAYFPPALTRHHPEAVRTHPLRREIVATSLANEVVDRGGMTWVSSLREEASATTADVVAAYLVTVAVFDLPELWAQLDGLPGTVATTVADEVVRESHRLIRRAAHWLLTRRDRPLPVDAETRRFGPPVRAVAPRLPALLSGHEAATAGSRAAALTARGVPGPLALRTAALPHGVGLLDVVEVTQSAGDGAPLPLDDVARLYYTLSARR
ncbi:NAD-glutamate dehydrogenase [Pseudonocardia xinjiangensis]